MRLTFDRKTLHELSINIQPPPTNEGGLKDFIPNLQSKPYYVWDTAHPPGFGLYVGKKAKTFVVQVRIGQKVKKVKVGVYGKSGSQANNLTAAREAAAAIVAKLKDGIDVTKERQHGRHVLTQSLNDVLDAYLENYKEGYRKNGKEPRLNTVAAIQAAKRRFGATGTKLLSELTGENLNDVFTRIKDIEGHRTAAEQTMRWGEAAFKHAMARDADRATARGGQAIITNNPFKAVTHKLRTRAELQRQAKENAKKNPLSMERGTLGLWLDVLWEKRRANKNAADYFLCTLFLGTRRAELSNLIWGDKLKSPVERATVNHIDIGTRQFILPVTKNGNTHELPLPRFIWHVMHERYINRGDNIHVFPAQKANKNRMVEHYSDPRSFLESINKTLAEKVVGTDYESYFTWVDKTRRIKKVKHGVVSETATTERIIKLSMHDLRRTFATISATIPMPYLITKRLLNHSVAGDVTGGYVDLSIEKIREYIQLVENEILQCSKNIVQFIEGEKNGS